MGKLIIVLDLDLQGWDADALNRIASAARERGGISLIAVGAHVHAEKLAVAEEVGFDFVLTKDQAHRELGELLATLA